MDQERPASRSAWGSASITCSGVGVLAAEELLDPPPDRRRGLGRELLAADRAGQRRVGVRPAGAPVAVGMDRPRLLHHLRRASGRPSSAPCRRLVHFAAGVMDPSRCRSRRTRSCRASRSAWFSSRGHGALVVEQGRDRPRASRSPPRPRRRSRSTCCSSPVGGVSARRSAICSRRRGITTSVPNARISASEGRRPGLEDDLARWRDLEVVGAEPERDLGLGLHALLGLAADRVRLDDVVALAGNEHVGVGGDRVAVVAAAAREGEQEEGRQDAGPLLKSDSAPPHGEKPRRAGSASRCRGRRRSTSSRGRSPCRSAPARGAGW